MIARFVTGAVVLLTAGFCVGDDTKEGKPDDKDRLQGEWVVVSANLGGKEAEGLKDGKLVVEGDKWTAPTGDKFTFEIDAAKTPKTLDLTGEQGRTAAGIYKIEGDTLTLCRSQSPGGKRPAKFKAGPGIVLMVYKRADK